MIPKPRFDDWALSVHGDPLQVPICSGCGNPIREKFILRVSPNLEWHPGCLKCVDCGLMLDETQTCFVRNEKTYCKRDYVKLFGTKCNKCNIGFNETDFVMRAKDRIYHVECFKCVTCQRQLMPGDECAFREDGLLCKSDHNVLPMHSMLGRSHDLHHIPGFSPLNHGIPNSVSPLPLDGVHTPSGVRGAIRRSSGSTPKRKETKTTRVRTVLNEKQLHTLRTCYAANCRPDALMKEQLTEMTGLSSRVIRVWFQNKRCKDKKKSIALKQMQEEQAKLQNGGEKIVNSSGSQGISGVAMIAAAPVKNDSDNCNSADVQNFHQTAWKSLSEFAMHNDLEQPFQQLMTQFSDHTNGSISDSSEICSIPSVSSATMNTISTTCLTPLAGESSAPVFS